MKMSSGEAFYSSLQSCSFPAPKFRCGGGSDTKFMTSMSVYVRGYISIAGTRQLFKCLHFDIQRWVTITLMFLMALFRHNSTFRGKKKKGCVLYHGLAPSAREEAGSSEEEQREAENDMISRKKTGLCSYELH